MSWIVEDEELRQLAARVIQAREEIGHVELDRVLVLRSYGKPPQKGVKAECFSFRKHPIELFTPHPFAVVVYDQETDYFTPPQMALLIFHELLHIPRRGFRLVDHDRQDFAKILAIGGVHWALEEGAADVPDILEGIP